MQIINGMEKAFVGMGTRCGQVEVAVYSVEKCIEEIIKQMKRDDLELTGGETYEENAWEHFEYNIRGAWNGDETPMFLEADTWEDFLEKKGATDYGTLPVP